MKTIHKLRTKPYKYQIECTDEIETFEGRCLLAMEVGTGKSLVSLMYAVRHPELRPIVVVCPASIKWNWRNEVLKHAGIPCEILEGMTPDKQERLYKPNTIWIVNYDILSAWIPFLKSLKPQIIIGDEIHYAKSRKASRSKAFRELCKGVKHVLALSGTPLTNRPAELFNILNILRSDVFKSFFSYASKFCNMRMTPFGMDYSGAKNLPELHLCLTNTVMCRRRKVDVLKDLPGKSNHVVMLPLEDRDQYDDAVNDFGGWIRDHKPGKLSSAMRAEAITKLSFLKQLVGRLKLKATFGWVDNFLEDSEGKIILFAVHKAVVSALMERYGGTAVKVDGSVVGKRRQEAFDIFTRNPEIRVFVGNVQAAGVGWNGVAASSMAFCEFPWTPGELTQAKGRIDRIGQKTHSDYYYLVAQNTIEEKLVEMLEKKAKILSTTLDGGGRESDIDIYSRLLKELGRET